MSVIAISGGVRGCGLCLVGGGCANGIIMEEKVTATLFLPQPANIPIVRLEEMSNWQQLLDLLNADVAPFPVPCLFPCCPCPPCVLFMPQQSIVYNSFRIVYNSLGIVYNSFRIVYNVYH